MLTYSAAVLRRAARAWSCSPFHRPLFEAMTRQGIPLSHISGSVGLANGYTRYPIPELEAEAELMWLIQVGVLRREVDGQGITDSYRLAPIGRQLLMNYADDQLAHSSPLNRLINFWTRRILS